MKITRLRAGRFAAFFAVVLLSAISFAQVAVPKTPYAGFELPPYGSQDWITYWNYNWGRLDTYFGGQIAFAHGIMIDTPGAQPTCSVSTRGLIWNLLGSTDLPEVCKQIGGNSYGWVAMGTGSAWYTGSGAPTNFFNNGDFYIDSASGNYYEQVSGSWQLLGSLRGTAGVGVPAGGTMGQVLAKNSSTNYDDAWINAPSGGTTVAVNGSNVATPNFNNTTPAAGSGNVNATVQSSGSSVSMEVPTAVTQLGFTPENPAHKDVASGYAGLDSGGKLKILEAPTWNQNTTGTAAGLSANITESQVTNLSSDLAAKLGQSYNPDWNAVSGPTLVLNKPTIPAAQVNSDWNAVSGVAQILNKPTVPTASSSTPPMDGAGTSGSSANYARADHQHPTDTTLVPKATTVNGHALSANVTVSQTDVGLANVTNDAQTKAAVVPNTVPSAGQIHVGNAGGTAFGVVSVSGDCVLASAGAFTCTKTSGTAFGTLATLPVGAIPAGYTLPYSQLTGAPSIPVPATVAPLMDGSATVGTSTLYARQDHVHPTDTTLVPKTTTVNGHALSANVTVAPADLPTGTLASGVSVPYAQVTGAPSVPTASATTPSMDGAGAIGSLTTSFALADHQHPTDTSRAADAAVVHNAGNEAIAGVKTFSQPPGVPTPVNPGDAGNKAYIDAHATLPDVTDTTGVHVNVSVPLIVSTGPLQISGTKQSGTTVTVPTTLCNGAACDFSFFVGSDSQFHCQLASGASCGSTGSASWGTITGTLSAQSDLTTALTGKAGVSGSSVATDVLVANNTGTLASAVDPGGLQIPNANTIQGPSPTTNFIIRAATPQNPTGPFTGAAMVVRATAIGSTATGSTVAGITMIAGSDNAENGGSSTIINGGDFYSGPGGTTGALGSSNQIPGYGHWFHAYRVGTTNTAGHAQCITAHNTITDCSVATMQPVGILPPSNGPFTNPNGGAAYAQWAGVLSGARSFSAVAWPNTNDIVCTDPANPGYLIDSGSTPCACPNSFPVGVNNLNEGAGFNLHTITINIGSCAPAITNSSSAQITSAIGTDPDVPSATGTFTTGFSAEGDIGGGLHSSGKTTVGGIYDSGDITFAMTTGMSTGCQTTHNIILPSAEAVVECEYYVDQTVADAGCSTHATISGQLSYTDPWPTSGGALTGINMNVTPANGTLLTASQQASSTLSASQIYLPNARKFVDAASAQVSWCNDVVTAPVGCSTYPTFKMRVKCIQK